MYVFTIADVEKRETFFNGNTDKCQITDCEGVLENTALVKENSFFYKSPVLSIMELSLVFCKVDKLNNFHLDLMFGQSTKLKLIHVFSQTVPAV